MDNNSQRGGNTGLPFKVLEPVAPVEPTDQKPRTHLRALVLKKLTREELEAIDQKEHEWGAMGRDTFPYALVLMNRKQFAANAAVPDLVLAAGDQVKDQVKDLIVSAIKAEKEDLKDSLTQFAQVLEAGKAPPSLQISSRSSTGAWPMLKPLWRALRTLKPLFLRPYKLSPPARTNWRRSRKLRPSQKRTSLLSLRHSIARPPISK